MMAALLFAVLLAADGPVASAPQNPPAAHTTTISLRRTGDTEEDELQAQFTNVRRIYVDVLSGGESAVRLRDLIIASLEASKVFIVTEDEDRADAILKGAGKDDVFTDVFTSSDTIGGHTQNGHSSSSREGRGFGSSVSKSGGIGLNESESEHTEERKHEALATVRLVDRDGDVIWAVTEESLGAKFKGASADVADRIAKRLALDYQRAKIARQAKMAAGAGSLTARP
ncbi:MAG: hypothetical protein ACRD4P_11305 [Bryobacteraceae bacterium]